MRDLVAKLLARYLKMSADSLDHEIGEVDYVGNARDILSRLERRDSFNMDAAKNLLEQAIENDDEIEGYHTGVPANEENIKTASLVLGGAINLHTGIVLGKVGSIEEAVSYLGGIPEDSVFAFEENQDGCIEISMAI